MPVDLAQLDYVGNTLRAWNAEIKSALVEVGQAPVGSVSPELGRALFEAQTNYERLREAYTFIYRAVWGEVPAGLTGHYRPQLGVLLAPIALSNPATALTLIVVAVAVGGIAWQAMDIFRDALRVWRERQAGTLQQSTLQVLQQNREQARAAGDTAAVARYDQQIADVAGRSPYAPDDLLAWAERNIVWIAGGVLGFVLLTRR